MIEALERLGVHLPSLVIYVMNFLVLWLVLHFVAFRPFMRRLQERTREEEEQRAQREEIGQLLEEARQARGSALVQAREERDALLRSAEELQDKLAREGAERGKEAGRRELDKAREEILRETLRARQALRCSFIELVLAASERTLGRVVDEEVRQKLIEEATQELADLEQVLPALLASGWAIVTTAAPVDPSQRDKISECLAQLAGRPVRTYFEVDPAVLGGLSVRTADALADATLQGRLERLRRHLLSQG